MKIECIDNKTFKLTNGSENLGHLKYDGFFTLKAEIVIKDKNFNTIPKGIFNVEITVVLEDAEIATLRMNWRGNIIISYENGEEYILKPTGSFMSKYAIEDAKGDKILVLDPDINLAKLNYNYTILSENNPDILLVLLATYATNYYIMVMAAVL